MKRRDFLYSASMVGAGLALSRGLYADDAEKGAAGEKLIGMYVHQHWPYHHPYAARTWTLEDWRGYLEGLHRLGYNMVMIWPMLETMPIPLTASDQACLEKIRQVIDMAHHDFHMKVWIALCPNVSADDEHASRVTFEKRHFFYCDTRVNPGDPKAMDALMARREELLRPLAQVDAIAVIDSDPGGYAGSTNKEFVDLLMRHRQLFDKLRPGIELVYWVHAGWPAYSRWYATGKFELGKPDEYLEAFNLLKERNLEPWGLATMGRSDLPRKTGLESRVMSLNYGTIEGEPSFPMTNFGGDSAYQSGSNLGPRGALGNAQTHCVQLPNTFAFSRGAQGLPLNESDYVQFANDLIVGRGELIVAAWRALSGSDAAVMRTAVDQLTPLTKEKLETGPLKGLLFGDPNRFINDLCRMLRMKAAFLDLAAAVNNQRPVAKPFAEFIQRVEQWQLIHGYENSWWWPEMNNTLTALNVPSLTAFLNDPDYRDTDKCPGNTPFDRVRTLMAYTETYTLRLIQAMKLALWEIESRSS
jgi:hypothetical protein